MKPGMLGSVIFLSSCSRTSTSSEIHPRFGHLGGCLMQSSRFDQARVLLICQLLSPWQSILAKSRFELSCDGDAGQRIVLSQLQHPEAPFRRFLAGDHATITSMHMHRLHLPNLKYMRPLLFAFDFRQAQGRFRGICLWSS